MKERYSYSGTLNGIKGVWCDRQPEGLEIEETVTFYTPDEGKVFVDKEGNLIDSVVIRDGIKIEDYVEIKDPRENTEVQ